MKQLGERFGFAGAEPGRPTWPEHRRAPQVVSRPPDYVAYLGYLRNPLYRSIWVSQPVFPVCDLEHISQTRLK